MAFLKSYLFVGNSANQKENSEEIATHTSEMCVLYSREILGHSMCLSYSLMLGENNLSSTLTKVYFGIQLFAITLTFNAVDGSECIGMFFFLNW